MATYSNLSSLAGLQVGDVVTYTVANYSIDFYKSKVKVELYGSGTTDSSAGISYGGKTIFTIDTSNLTDNFYFSTSGGCSLCYGSAAYDAYYRIGVAGNGGGGIYVGGANTGGNGGGITGGNSKRGGVYATINYGGTQTAGGSGSGADGTFGAGGANGGAGWYGGGGAFSVSGGGGGSGFVIGQSTTTYPAGYMGDSASLISTLEAAVSDATLTQGGNSDQLSRRMIVTILEVGPQTYSIEDIGVNDVRRCWGSGTSVRFKNAPLDQYQVLSLSDYATISSGISTKLEVNAIEWNPTSNKYQVFMSKTYNNIYYYRFLEFDSLGENILSSEILQISGSSYGFNDSNCFFIEQENKHIMYVLVSSSNNSYLLLYSNNRVTSKIGNFGPGDYGNGRAFLGISNGEIIAVSTNRKGVGSGAQTGYNFATNTLYNSTYFSSSRLYGFHDNYFLYGNSTDGLFLSDTGFTTGAKNVLKKLGSGNDYMEHAGNGIKYINNVYFIDPNFDNSGTVNIAVFENSNDLSTFNIYTQYSMKIFPYQNKFYCTGDNGAHAYIISKTSEPVPEIRSSLKYYNGSEFEDRYISYYDGEKWVDCDLYYYSGLKFNKIGEIGGTE